MADPDAFIGKGMYGINTDMALGISMP